MEESTTRDPKPNEFVIPEEQAYAWTDIEVAKIAEYLLTKLEPVGIETLDPNDRVCAICQEEFQVLNDFESPVLNHVEFPVRNHVEFPFLNEFPVIDDVELQLLSDVRIAHTPVKMVCGHIFGRTCIMKWLDPLCYCIVPEIGPRDVDEILHEVRTPGNTSCPSCRRVFFSEVFLEPLELLGARLWFWDYIYGLARVARSTREEHSRKYLWRYVNYRRSINGIEIYGESERALLKGAQKFFLEFATELESQALTSVQADLRDDLQRLAERDLKDLILDVPGNFSLIFRTVALEREPESVL